MAQSGGHRFLTPFLIDLGLLFFHALELLSVIYEAISGVRPSVEQHILHALEQFFVNLLVHLQHAGIHDAHVQAGLHGVIQKRRVHRLAHHVVAPERK